MKYFLIFFSVIIFSCQSDSSNKKDFLADNETLDTNLEMTLLLDSLRSSTNPIDNLSLNKSRAIILENQLSAETNPSNKLQIQFQLGLEQMRAGNAERAIGVLSELVESLEHSGLGINDQTKPVYQILALAYLRLGEQENCIVDSNPASCILPFSENGEYSFKRGSEMAIGLYTRLLNVFPNDPTFQWLLNFAYMTIGEYPQMVPAQFLINPEIFSASSTDFLSWPNTSLDQGVAVNGLSGSVCMEDFNNDGLLDLLVTSYGLNDPCQYFENTENGFVERTKDAGLEKLYGGLNMVHADYNNDGYEDVLVLRGGWFNKSGAIPNSLLRNNGNSTFTDVTKETGLLSFHPTQTATWADFNNDGFLDLFIGNETSNAEGNSVQHPCELFINKGGQKFIEVSIEAKLEISAFVKGVVSGDINEDGWQDIYVSINGSPNQLYINKGLATNAIPQFEEQAATYGVTEPVFSFPVWFWDYNQDGKEDLFVGSYDNRQPFNVAAFQFSEYKGTKTIEAVHSMLYLNKGNSQLIDQSKIAALDKSLFAMGSNYGDLNNDSYPDFYVGTGSPDFSSIVPNRMFLNKTDGTFSEITMNGFGHIQKGHGIAFGDYDNDGDQDIYAVMGGAYEGDIAPNVLFENPMNATNWLNIKLEGTTSNRSAIGAKIVLIVKTVGGERKIYRTVRTGGSFGSNPLRQFFGLEGVDSIKEIQVYWPGKKSPEIISGPIEFNQFLIITEAANILN